MNQLEKDNRYIKRWIESNQPFFIGRIAGIELQVCYTLYTNDLMPLRFQLEELENNAGIKITGNESLKEYVDKLTESYDHCSCIAEWEKSGKVFAITGRSQEWIEKRTPHIQKINAMSLEPYYVDDSISWMSSLQNKKILIIHPFIHTFKQQLEKLDEIFPNRTWFKNCTFNFIKPPMTLAGNHENKDWRNHYKEFVERIRNLEEFDIALIAAGGYGMLISDMIYSELHKSVIYIGGALQLFFGVIGKRWFTNKEIMKFVNDEWIRPVKEDKPDNFVRVEKGCYW
jgi:hypothetical protein